MGITSTATLHEGQVLVTFDQPTAELVLTHEQAFLWGDHLSRLADQLRARGESNQPVLTTTAVRVGLRGVLVTMTFPRRMTRLVLTLVDTYFVSDELIIVAQKAEKRTRGLLPSRKDVDRMDECLTEVGHHRFIQHAPGEIWKPAVMPRGIRLVNRLPMLSRLIRRPWT